MAGLTLDRLLAAGEVPPVVVLDGEGEDALEAVARLRDTIVDPSLAGMNVVSFNGSESGIDEVLTAVRTQAFGSGGRLVVLRDPGALPEADRNRLADYLAAPARGNTLAVVAGSLDHRQRLFREADARKWLVVFPSGAAARRGLVVESLARVGLSADEDALKVLEESLPDDKGIINREAEKLAAATDGRVKRLTRRDLEGLVIGRAPVDGFDVSRRLQRGDVAGALRVLDRLIEEGAEPVQLLGLLTRECRLLLQALAVASGRVPPSTFPELARIPPGVKKAMADGARRIGRDALRERLLGLRDVDRRLKSTATSPALLLEAFLAGWPRGSGAGS